MTRPRIPAPEWDERQAAGESSEIDTEASAADCAMYLKLIFGQDLVGNIQISAIQNN